ncbi:hypothetical protein NDU88_009801 [Pleurodeles waltl]|uniref:Uncharacterized protein n=1 Tax=Pleurodeles waltl TaxID=8319 RepID=A0AAV7PX08_PLEWA|nr:hypothetical protein NDU88_009801 [Pleurodeles waltl]
MRDRREEQQRPWRRPWYRARRHIVMRAQKWSNINVRAYLKAWKAFEQSGACRRQEQWDKVEDVVQFILGLIQKGQSRVTNSGKLAGIAFMGKLLWGYAPTAGDLGK